MFAAIALLITAAAPPIDRDGLLAYEQTIAAAVARRVDAAPPTVRIETTPTISSFEDGVVREAQYDQLPPAGRAAFDAMAATSRDEPSGRALFDDMFYRFFFVHELGHWLMERPIAAGRADVPPLAGDRWTRETDANRVAVAWWREQAPAYLDRLVANFRAILAKLPNPVPPGQDPVRYFDAHYDSLGQDPSAYGWFQLTLVVDTAGKPRQSFDQVVRDIDRARHR